MSGGFCEGDMELIRAILERLDIGNRVGFRYRTLKCLGLAAMDRALEQGMLREIHRAMTFPDPQGRTLYDLEVLHTAQGIIAVSEPGDEWIDSIPLSEDDIRQFEVVIPRLCRRICAENGIDDQVREYSRAVVFLGEREVGGYGLRPIYLLYDNLDEPRFVDRCRGIGARGWTIILTPRPVDLSAANRRYLAEMNFLLVPISLYLGEMGWVLPWTKIAAALAGQGQVKETYQPVADLTFEHLPGLSCSPDYRIVRSHGKEFALTEMMVRAFKFMVENSPLGPRDIPQALILEECETVTPSLVNVFKRLKDWKSLVAPGVKKGTYRINL